MGARFRGPKTEGRLRPKKEGTKQMSDLDTPPGATHILTVSWDSGHSESVYLSADLAQASAGIEYWGWVDQDEDGAKGDGWVSTQYQTADARHDAQRMAELIAATLYDGPDDHGWTAEIEDVEDDDDDDDD